jgi:nitrate reductase (cytochrome), electron transfer subunit
MDPDGGSSPALSARLFLIVAAVVLMGAAILVIESRRSGDRLRADRISVAAAIRGEPIPAEADVFRTRPGDFAVDAEVERRREAHPRDLTMFRALREFPGAPPRIPHGLTAEEYRSTGCNACHQRGGYSVRFASYTPMTPHPEYSDCLQCHLPDARLVGIGLPQDRPDSHCHQCHAPDGTMTPALAALDWRPGEWPRVGQRVTAESPQLIPHDLQLRGNCVACHYGPAAVAEIRTLHADRANCRQCHIPAAPEAGFFTRAATAGGDIEGGRP